MEAKAAFELLTDEGKRAEYDRRLRMASSDCMSELASDSIELVLPQSPASRDLNPLTARAVEGLVAMVGDRPRIQAAREDLRLPILRIIIAL